MVVDILRSSYQTTFRPFVDSDFECNVRWYPAPDGALLMPDHHIYASSNWNRDKTVIPSGPGEVYGAKKTFLTGRNPPFYLGQCRVGTDEAWQHGLSVKAMDLPAPPLPDCCSLPLAFAGVAEAGEALQFVSTPAVISDSVTFTLSGYTGFCSPFNRSYTLTQDPPGNLDRYLQTDSVHVGFLFFSFTLVRNPISGQWVLSADNSGQYSRFTNPGPWDQASPLVMVHDLATPNCAGGPSSVTVTPVP